MLLLAFLDLERIVRLIWVGAKFGASPLLRWLFGLPPTGPNAGVRLRRAFEELGITYLKLGQFLTMRFDVLPAEVCTELNKLFESVPPMPFREARRVVEMELNAPLETLFLSFEREPIAAASVAQVHEARTAGNERVAVKIQRKNIDRLFAADMRNLRRIARLIDASGLAGAFSAQEVAGQFTHWTSREMDFEVEGRTAGRLRQNAAPYEVIPRIHWPLTTKKVLTMEFIEGISLAKIGAMIDAGRPDLVTEMLPNLDEEVVGRRIAFAVLRQLFVFGFFQGDPHPGNVLIRADNTVAFVDFGIFGELTKEQRENFAGFLESLALGNIDMSFQFYTRQHAPTADTDLKAFEREAKTILRLWHQTTVNPFATARQRHMGRYAVYMIEAIRRHRLRTNPDVLLLWRALYALDASSERLSDYFDMMAQVRAFFVEFRPGPITRVVRMLGDEQRNAALLQLTRHGPGRIGPLLTSVARRETPWPSQVAESPADRHAADREVRWLSAGLVSVSLAVMVKWSGMPGPSHVVAVIVVLALAVAAVRKR
jgi:ubiquinone biosynthesis protein